MARRAIALDLGGTQIRCALVDGQGRILARMSVLTQAEEGLEAVLARLEGAIRWALKEAPGEGPVAIGVAVPGPVDPRRGTVRFAPNLPGWLDIPLQEILEEAIRLPLYVGNDANLAALAEERFGAGRGREDIIYLTLSTGIGGGVISGGKLVLGSHGLACEPGHMVLEPKGPRCGCGKRGCLEALASGRAIAREARKALAKGEPSLLPELVGGDPQRVDARIVAEAARQGDALAQTIYQRAGFYVGLGIVNLMHLFNPEVAILGGGVSRAGELLFSSIRQTVVERAHPSFQEDFAIVRSELGDDVGLLGAAAWAFSHSP